MSTCSLALNVFCLDAASELEELRRRCNMICKKKTSLKSSVAALNGTAYIFLVSYNAFLKNQDFCLKIEKKTYFYNCLIKIEILLYFLVIICVCSRLSENLAKLVLQVNSCSEVWQLCLSSSQCCLLQMQLMT